MKPKTWNFLSEVKTGAGLDGTGRDVLSGIGGLNLETAGQTWRPGIRTEKCCQNPTMREKLFLWVNHLLRHIFIFVFN